MIRANLALTRQAQDMFRAHLVGVIGWDEVEFAPREKRIQPPTAGLSRQERRRLREDKPEGKFEQEVCLRFGVWEIRIESPADHPPLGCVTMTGDTTIKGPLDPSTWDEIGRHIKQKTEELKNGESPDERLWS